MTYQLFLNVNQAWYIIETDGTILFKTRNTALAYSTYERLLNDETRTSSVHTPNKTT
jgi:hypothetical protein